MMRPPERTHFPQILGENTINIGKDMVQASGVHYMYFIRILLLPKNELNYFQSGKNVFQHFFAKINFFILSEKRISTKM